MRLMQIFGQRRLSGRRSPPRASAGYPPGVSQRRVRRPRRLELLRRLRGDELVVALRLLSLGLLAASVSVASCAGELLDQLRRPRRLCSALRVQRLRDLLQPRGARLKPDPFRIMLFRARLGLVGVELNPGSKSLDAPSASSRRCRRPAPPSSLGTRRRLVTSASSPEFGPQRGDLAFVGPAEHPTPRVVNAVTVVLLVPVPRAHLAFAGDRTPLGCGTRPGLPHNGSRRASRARREILLERPVPDLDAVGQQQPVVCCRLQANRGAGDAFVDELGSTAWPPRPRT